MQHEWTNLTSSAWFKCCHWQRLHSLIGVISGVTALTQISCEPWCSSPMCPFVALVIALQMFTVIITCDNLPQKHWDNLHQGNMWAIASCITSFRLSIKTHLISPIFCAKIIWLNILTYLSLININSAVYFLFYFYGWKICKMFSVKWLQNSKLHVQLLEI